MRKIDDGPRTCGSKILLCVPPPSLSIHACLLNLNHSFLACIFCPLFINLAPLSRDFTCLMKQELARWKVHEDAVQASTFKRKKSSIRTLAQLSPLIET
ncbi:hypothetical protein VTL71DRAFT_1465 [Oculimacula yallundae]|uniref:Uncharacterized protein n=1 Tax=Oculimacula yallundae TaxID=86028 RepID=A0ABR4CC54_9HELO